MLEAGIDGQEALHRGVLRSGRPSGGSGVLSAGGAGQEEMDEADCKSN